MRIRNKVDRTETSPSVPPSVDNERTVTEGSDDKSNHELDPDYDPVVPTPQIKPKSLPIEGSARKNRKKGRTAWKPCKEPGDQESISKSEVLRAQGRPHSGGPSRGSPCDHSGAPSSEIGRRPWGIEAKSVQHQPENQAGPSTRPSTPWELVDQELSNLCKWLQYDFVPIAKTDPTLKNFLSTNQVPFKKRKLFVGANPTSLSNMIEDDLSVSIDHQIKAVFLNLKAALAKHLCDALAQVACQIGSARHITLTTNTSLDSEHGPWLNRHPSEGESESPRTELKL